MNPGKTLLLLQFLLCAATAAAQSAEQKLQEQQWFSLVQRIGEGFSC